MKPHFAPVLVTLLAAACGPSNPASDASDIASDITSDTRDASRTDTAGQCTTDNECNDSVFCNGVERCMPGAAGADSRGCLAAAPATPCAGGQVCNEAMSRCLTMCSTTMDADGDGHASMNCGGDDCDDSDANRYPGNAEVCAFTATGTGAAHRAGGDHDEDCNPATVSNTATHDGDHDGDGFVDIACTNTDSTGTVHRGDDCNDADPVTITVGPTMTTLAPANIHPGQSEACNGADDNCDARIDEGVQRAFFPDADHDNYGLVGADPVFACRPPANTAESSTDCDDGNAQVHPGAFETCNGADDDCNGMTDDGAAPGVLCAAMYGSPSHTVFGCSAGACTTNCVGSWGDCDGQLNTGCETDLSRTVDHCGTCATNCGAGGVCTPTGASTTPFGTCDQVTGIRAGNHVTCAIRSVGPAVCWGANAYGQLGDGSTDARITAAPVSGIGRVTELAVSHFEHTISPAAAPCDSACAFNGNAARCWGCDLYGQLGNASSSTSTLPVTVVGYPPAVSTDYSVLQLGGLSVGFTHACAVQVVNTGGLLPGDPPTYASALCWGDNLSAALGTTFLPYSSVYNVAFTSPGATYMQVSAGMHFTCAVAYPGGALSAPVTCWGNNGFGQLGIGTSSPFEATPRTVNTITNAVEVTTGEQHACARLASGQVHCWGSNSSGALGDGTTIDHYSPAAVTGVTDAVQLASNQLMTCARRSSGRVACWGTGPLGNGMTSSNVPVAVTGIDNAIDVSIGVDHGCVVRSDHSVFCWGGNANGQLGTGATMASTTPVRAIVVSP